MSEIKTCFFDQEGVVVVKDEGELYRPTPDTPTFYFEHWDREVYLFTKEDKEIPSNPTGHCALETELMSSEPYILANFPCFRCQRRISIVPKLNSTHGHS